MTDSERIRKMLGISRAEFSRRYHIPIRTLEAWDAGDRIPPAYVVELLERVVKENIEKGESTMKIDDIRMAKRVLEDGGVKVFQKDIKDVKVHKFNMESPDGEVFPHRYIFRVEMKDGRIYEAVKETVDKEGKFSTASARFKTTKVTEL